MYGYRSFSHLSDVSVFRVVVVNPRSPSFRRTVVLKGLLWIVEECIICES